MGLAVTILDIPFLEEQDKEGAQWRKDDLAALNAVLEDNGLMAVTGSPGEYRDEDIHWASYPYSFLHYLRRVYALLDQKMDVEPLWGEMTEKDFSIIEDAGCTFSSHLLCHSDCEGFYVPRRFAEPIFDDRIAGGMLGSCQVLLAELAPLAKHIGVTIIDGELPKDENKRLMAITDEETWYREQIVFHSLWQAAKISLATEAPILFT